VRHKKHRTRMGRSLGHRTATLRNLARALVLSEGADGNKLYRIETTATKAKVLRPFIENLITLGKKGTVHHRRQAFQKLQCKQTVHCIFEELAPAFKDREGGYTRITRTRYRMGDAAEMAYIELVDRESVISESSA
jgi:large subunit ribosomal protein L17